MCNCSVDSQIQRVERTVLHAPMELLCLNDHNQNCNALACSLSLQWENGLLQAQPRVKALRKLFHQHLNQNVVTRK